MKLLISFFSLSLTMTDAIAQSPDTSAPAKKIAPWFVEKFKVSGGFFLPVDNTDLQVGLNGTANGTEINLEKDLGLSDQVGTFLAGFQWRISRRSRINLGFYNIKRSSTHTLTKDVIFKDDTFRVNSSVSGFFNTAIYQFSYGYAILAKPKYEAGIIIGTHTVGGQTGLSVNSMNGGISSSSDFGFTAPLPDLGIWGGYAFSKRFAANLDLDYLSLSVDNYTGSIFAYNLTLSYRLINKLDIFLAYTGLNFEVETSKKDVFAQFKWGYNGPSLALSYSFGKRSWEH